MKRQEVNGSAKFYGSVTIGERGQIALPAELRRELDLAPGDKLLVMHVDGRPVIYLMKSDLLTAVLDKVAEPEVRR